MADGSDRETSSVGPESSEEEASSDDISSANAHVVTQLKVAFRIYYGRTVILQMKTIRYYHGTIPVNRPAATIMIHLQPGHLILKVLNLKITAMKIVIMNSMQGMGIKQMMKKQE